MTIFEPSQTRDGEMICHPTRWPHIVLPLVRANNQEFPGGCAVFAPPLSATKIDPTQPIEILIGTMFHDLSKLPRKTYPSVYALLADGWKVD